MQLHNVVVHIASASLVLWMCSVKGIRNTTLFNLHKVSMGFKTQQTCNICLLKVL